VCKDYGKDNKTYFHERYVDLMWYGRKGIRRRIKGVCGSFPCIQYYYDSKLDVVRRIVLGKECVCDIGKKGGEYGNKMYSYHCNGKWLMDSYFFG
jgi:hypothetical protein